MPIELFRPFTKVQWTVFEKYRRPGNKRNYNHTIFILGLVQYGFSIIVSKTSCENPVTILSQRQELTANYIWKSVFNLLSRNVSFLICYQLTCLHFQLYDWCEISRFVIKLLVRTDPETKKNIIFNRWVFPLRPSLRIIFLWFGIS